MKVSKRIISIGLIGVLSVGVLTSCNSIGKYTPKQLVMIDEYRDAGYEFIDSLGSFQPEIERVFDNGMSFVTMKDHDDMVELSKEMKTEINKVCLVETPKAFEESDSMFKSGIVLINKVVEDMKDAENKFNTREECDEALYKLGDGMKKMTEAIKYRTENEMDY